MANLLTRLRGASPDLERGQFPAMSFQDYVAQVTKMSFDGQTYTLGSSPESIAASFQGLVQGVHNRNGVVAAAVVARGALMSQVRFQWRSEIDGNRFTNPELDVLNRPVDGPRARMLALAEYDVSYSGSWFAVRSRGDRTRLRRLRPDWVTVIMGSDQDPDSGALPSDARVTSYVYQPVEGTRRARAEIFFPDEVIQWTPEPDPECWWRGTSWVGSVMREILGDGQATDHTAKFFEHGATPNMVFSMDPNLTADQVREFARLTNEQHAGTRNAYKNLYVGGGANAQVVGSDLGSLSLKDLHGGYESRIASRSRVPAVVLGIREGMQGSALNSGNYAQTRRLWADAWFHPTAEGLCAAAERVLTRPDASELAYDPSRILFLQEDEKDAADIVSTQGSTIRALIDGGYDPQTVVDAVATGDITKLRHTGNLSVQLQPPGTTNGDTP